MSFENFKLHGEAVFITGGAGLLGSEYVKAVQEINGFPVVLDIKAPADKNTVHVPCDITKEKDIVKALKTIKSEYKRPVYGLINNAAIDPKFDRSAPGQQSARLEAYARDAWDTEIAVGLTGAFLCTKIFGPEMARLGKGSIVNISSVLGCVAPDQALYRKEGVADQEQPVKPVTYSVIKHGIIGLTKYTATYWASKGVRCNALAPGGVYTTHPDEFVQKLKHYIPLGRMAKRSEYNCAVQFLLTDASSFMTGAVLNLDGGQTTW